MQPFIIDSCSFLHAFHIEIAECSLCNLLEEHFKVLVHHQVDVEVPNALRQAYPSWREAGLVDEEFSSIRRRHAEWISSKLCHDDVNDIVARMGGDLSMLDAGERACIAFAKQTADSEMTYALFLTDDYDAGRAASRVFNKYQCGFVLRTADLITFFGLRYGLTKQQIHQALRDLLAFYNNTYHDLIATLTAEGVASTAVSELVWRGEFLKARQALAALSISAVRRRKLEDLIKDVEQLAGAESVIGYTIGRLRLLTETTI
jgi:hypothetical protein